VDRPACHGLPAPQPVTPTFGYAGGVQTWTVPSNGVTGAAFVTIRDRALGPFMWRATQWRPGRAHLGQR
jgi:hypothetical protein